MNQNYSIYQLRRKVGILSNLINIKKIIDGEKNSLEQIRSYYKINHWAYRHFHSQDGFMHFRVSQHGVITHDDVYHQADAVYKHIKPGDTVVELGPGQGANLKYLAASCPEAKFIGFDLQPPRDLELPPNAKVYVQDYSNLSQIADNSVAVVYAFETIVYCSDKEKVFREVQRILKPGGVLIVYDYSLKNRFEEYDADIQTAIALVSKGGAAAMIESLEEWNSHFTNCGLTLEKVTDYTENILPDMKRLERKADKIFKRPWLTKLVFNCLPSQFTGNIVLGWLGYNAYTSGLGYYDEWLVRKP